MLRWGGVYIDLDFIPKKPLDSFLKGKDYVYITEPSDNALIPGERLFNGFFATVPNHPFIKKWVESCVQTIDENYDNIYWDVLGTLGPVAFYNFYKKERMININKRDTCLFLPLTLKNKLFGKSSSESISADCTEEDFREAYAYTEWVNGTGWQFDVVSRYKWYIVFCIVIILMVVFRKKF
jgi:mannosyltransferase OCH1-like enzyme